MFFPISWNHFFKACYSLLRQELQMRLPTGHAANGQPCSRVHVAGRRAGTKQYGIIKSCYLIHSQFLFSLVFTGFKLALLCILTGFQICIDLMRIRILHFVRIRIQVSTFNLIITFLSSPHCVILSTNMLNRL
jgi:hypothetical protein